MKIKQRQRDKDTKRQTIKQKRQRRGMRRQRNQVNRQDKQSKAKQSKKKHTQKKAGNTKRQRVTSTVRICVTVCVSSLTLYIYVQGVL
jgi:hypothetical protein